MSKQVNYNENLCAGAAIRDDKGRRISKLFEAPHPKMTVGYARNLIMPSNPEEQEFNFRQAGGGVVEDGVAVIDRVKGNSVVWNQLMEFNATDETKGGISFRVSGNNLHFEGTNTEGHILSFTLSPYTINLYAGRKYILLPYMVGNVNYGLFVSGTYTNYIGIFSPANNETNRYVERRFNTGESVNETLTKPQLVDLTQMFGAGNEPATVEEFLSRKPKVADEFAYNEGTIVNNKVEAIKTSGVNLWDEECETSQNEITSKNFNPIIPGVRIYVKCPANSEIRFNWYDANKEYVSYYYTHNVESQVPANAHYFKILTYQYGTTYNHDICINLSDPAINGQYFPYEKHELDLSWVKEIKDAEGVKLFEDGMRSAGTAYDEVGKNKAVKRIGSVDLGTLPWDTSWWDADGRLYVNLVNKKVGEANIVYPLGATYNNDNQLKNVVGICGHINNSFIYIGDAKTHSSASEFINSLSGVYAYYELAEPIEVEYDEKNLTYPVVAGGTEEAIASEPSTAFRADIGYGIDAVKTILDLKARVEALEGK